jgi:hypothetical protein
MCDAHAQVLVHELTHAWIHVEADDYCKFRHPLPTAIEEPLCDFTSYLWQARAAAARGPALCL